MRLIDLTGKTFGKLTVTGRDYETQQRKKDREVWWHCTCECGNVDYSARGHDLRDGKILSCGCLRKENTRNIKFKDITGQRFGKLIVLGPSPKKGDCSYWTCQCDCGSPAIEVAVRHLNSGATTSCGCNKSKGELRIIQILNELEIDYIQQKEFEDLVNINALKFDFYLPQYNIAIEYNGIQHYEAIDYFGGEKRLQSQQECDKIKVDWCNSHGIKLLVIPYTDYSKLSIEYLENLINI